MSAVEWPVAALGPIARAKAVAAGMPTASTAEDVIDAPYDATWSWASDLEEAVPRFDRHVAAIRIRRRWQEDGVDRIRMRARSMGVWLPFDVRIEDGYCLMRGMARLYVVVMAAEPIDEGARTRFFHCEDVPLPAVGSILRPRIRREVDADLRTLKSIAESGF